MEILQQTFKVMFQWPDGSRLAKITGVLRQVFPHRADDELESCSCLLYCDFGMLPPVVDLPLCQSGIVFSHLRRSEKFVQFFDHTVVLNRPKRWYGDDLWIR